MSRYIDADVARRIISSPRSKEQMLLVLSQVEPADVVELVRCKDCKWYKSIYSWNCKEHKVCVRDPSEPPREPNDFCSYGERREDGE